jgi:hypothetical protein
MHKTLGLIPSTRKNKNKIFMIILTSANQFYSLHLVHKMQTLRKAGMVSVICQCQFSIQVKTQWELAFIF